MGLRAGLDWCGKSRLTGIRSVDRPARRQLLYRLRYPAPPPKSIAEVKERVEMYLYSPSGPSWPVLSFSLPLPLPYSDRQYGLPLPTAIHRAWSRVLNGLPLYG